MEEIKERALLYNGLKHYFMVKFPQRPGALKDFVLNVLGTNDDITHFEYTKKTPEKQLWQLSESSFPIHQTSKDSDRECRIWIILNRISMKTPMFSICLCNIKNKQ
jgi:hypothetical protein